MREAAGRPFLVILAAGALLASVSTYCGGLVDEGVPGTLDDAGTFRQPDGRIVFSPGSACSTYDAAAYLYVSSSPPACSDPQAGSGESASCEAWVLDAGLSFDFQPYAECIVQRCASFGFLADGVLSRCVPGPKGDAYCSALYQQFVVGAKRASYECNPFNHRCESSGASCDPATHYIDDDASFHWSADASGVLPTVEVIENDAATCELICTP